jgi:hypothetical protein
MAALFEAGADMSQSSIRAPLRSKIPHTASPCNSARA